jgi:hypothetical protein
LPPDLSLLRGLKPSVPQWQVYRDEVTKQVTVHAGTEIKLPLPYLDSPMKLTHFFDATLTEGQPNTAALDAAASAEFAMAKHQYVFAARQIAKYGRVEISVKVTEDRDVMYDKVITRLFDWP